MDSATLETQGHRNEYCTYPEFIFARFSGNAKQGFVRNFELDHFLSQLDEKNSELGHFFWIFLAVFTKMFAILSENLS